MKEAALAPRKLQFDVENEVTDSHVSAARALNTPAAKYRMDPWDELDEMFVSEDQMSISDDNQEFEDAEDPDPQDKMDDDLAVSRLQIVSGVTTWSTPQFYDFSFIFNGSSFKQRGSHQDFLLFGFYFSEKNRFLTFISFKL